PQIDVLNVLTTIARETHNDDLSKALANPVIDGVIASIGKGAQNLLAHSKGQILLAEVPKAGTDSAATLPRDLAIIIPMGDIPDVNATTAAALSSLTAQLQLVGGMSGQWTVTTNAAGSLVSGAIFKGSAVSGVQYTLTQDNLLVVALTDSPTALSDLLASLKANKPNAEAQQVTGKLPGQFLYAYADSPGQSGSGNGNSTVLLGGRIDGQTLLLSILLEPK